MRIYMAIKAVWESFMHGVAMRFFMTFLTLWNLTMADMTGCALQGSMFSRIGLKFIIDFTMTSGTDCIRHLFRIL